MTLEEVVVAKLQQLPENARQQQLVLIDAWIEQHRTTDPRDIQRAMAAVQSIWATVTLIRKRCAGSRKTKSWNMSLADLRDGNRVFIDANIFIYHFGGRSLECKALLERCARRVLLGYTSTPVLAEVLRRRMVAEAIVTGLVTVRTAVRKLGETPEMVKQLTQYQDDVSKIPHMHLIILPLTLDIVQASAEVRKREGLLTNDSFVVACMREQGLTQLATANGDFDRVGGIAIYKPTALEGQDIPTNLSV